MNEWKDGAHPNHPRGERSQLCRQCVMSHPFVEAELAKLRAELKRLRTRRVLERRKP